jgi:hypothetical protein
MRDIYFNDQTMIPIPINHYQYYLYLHRGICKSVLYILSIFIIIIYLLLINYYNIMLNIMPIMEQL